MNQIYMYEIRSSQGKKDSKKNVPFTWANWSLSKGFTKKIFVFQAKQGRRDALLKNKVKSTQELIDTPCKATSASQRKTINLIQAVFLEEVLTLWMSCHELVWQRKNNILNG
jgi:hypothetical protein